LKKILTAFVLTIFVVIPAALVVAAQFGVFSGRRPTDIGVHNHLLKPPGKNSQNVVSSQAAMHPHTDYHLIAPLKFSGDPAVAFVRLQKIITATKGTTMVVSQPDYLHVEYQTATLKFIDDVEFALDAAKREIHMRSASRLGRRDFGVNRNRLEKIRAAFDAN
jgi:uncharacterized protein (DUF1499 family)